MAFFNRYRPRRRSYKRMYMNLVRKLKYRSRRFKSRFSRYSPRRRYSSFRTRRWF